MTAEEVKLQQISQLYQYYSNLIIQQDQRLLQDFARAPRLGDPNHFSKVNAQTTKRDQSPATKTNNLLVQIDGEIVGRTSSPTSKIQEHQNPDIKIRYSTKQLLTIFKSLGRFQNPVEHPEPYGVTEIAELKKLMNSKPTVVLEHLRSSSALPLLVGQDLQIKSKILKNLTEQLSQKAL